MSNKAVPAADAPCPKRLNGAPHIRVRSPFTGCFNNPRATYCSQCYTRLADAAPTAR